MDLRPQPIKALLEHLERLPGIGPRSAQRLARAKEILKENGNYSWLTGRGSLVILNGGIEFAATYFIMLLALLVSGGGRFFSADYWLDKHFNREH